MSAWASVAAKISVFPRRARRIDVLGQLLGNDAIELGGDHLLVELLDLEADFIGRVGQIDFAGPRVQQVELLVLLEDDAGRASAVSIRIGGSWSIR